MTHHGTRQPTLSPSYWKIALRDLRSADKVLTILIDTLKVKPPSESVGRPPFVSLSRAIVGQQLSSKAARAIWGRIEALCDGEVTRRQFLIYDKAQFRSCGLSSRKVTYLRSLARCLEYGELNPELWPTMTDEELVHELTSIHGIGTWTAQMYLIFHERRPNVFATGDAGLRRAISWHYFGGKTANPKAMTQVASLWAPWRSVASLYLWKSLDKPPGEPE